MAFMKQSFLISFWRNFDRSETFIEFSIAVFSGRDESQSVEIEHNLRRTRVVDFNVPS